MSRGDGRYSVVRNDSTPAGKAAEDAEDAREFGKAVHLSYGRARVAVPAALIAALASSVGTYLATHTAASGDCAKQGDMQAVQKQVSEVSATLSTLSVTVGKNADTARNESVALAATVGQNARDANAAMQRVSDKLDIFMKFSAQK